MIEFVKRRCDFCKKKHEVVMDTLLGRRKRKICLECHTKKEKTREDEGKNYGTHKPMGFS